MTYFLITGLGRYPSCSFGKTNQYAIATSNIVGTPKDIMIPKSGKALPVEWLALVEQRWRSLFDDGKTSTPFGYQVPETNW